MQTFGMFKRMSIFSIIIDGIGVCNIFFQFVELDSIIMSIENQKIFISFVILAFLRLSISFCQLLYVQEIAEEQLYLNQNLNNYDSIRCITNRKIGSFAQNFVDFGAL